MRKLKTLKICLIFIVLAISGFITQNTIAQPVVGLDNWYNRETNAKTGKPFHYLWTDTEDSGYSRWGEIFTARGAKLTTVGKPDSKVLRKIDIYIIVDPDTTKETPDPNYIAAEDIKAIKSWVKNGGVLAVLANDAPNCEFTNLNKLMSEFGMTFNHVTLHPVTGTDFEMGACVDLPEHPLFKGVSKIYIKEVADINLSGTAKAILTENGKVLMAENKYGKGYVFAIGDPWIYNEYIDHDRLPASFENRKAAENLTDLLLSYTREEIDHMNSRERILSAINHRQPDRVPVDLGATPSSGISAVAYHNLIRHSGLSHLRNHVYDVIQEVTQPEIELLDKFGVDVLDAGRFFNSSEDYWQKLELMDRCPMSLSEMVQS